MENFSAVPILSYKSVSYKLQLYYFYYEVM